MKSKIVITPIEVTAGGETFKIVPFGFGQLPHVIGKLAAPLMLLKDIKEGSVIAIADLVAEGGDNLMDVVSLAINKPRGFINSLQDLDEGEALVAAVLEANKDTFEKKVLPKLSAMAPKLTPLLQNLLKAIPKA